MLVIAEQPDFLESRQRFVQQRVENLAGFEAPVDVVSEIDHHRLRAPDPGRIGQNHVLHLAQQIRPAVNVADDIDTPSGRCTRRHRLAAPISLEKVQHHA